MYNIFAPAKKTVPSLVYILPVNHHKVGPVKEFDRSRLVETGLNSITSDIASMSSFSSRHNFIKFPVVIQCRNPTFFRFELTDDSSFRTSKICLFSSLPTVTAV